ncbi:MAG TPA: cytochrome P460 family protein [Verrucomicrobiae bacterium]|nr:cytochrome P460 family protein [Verrucomicrobiae bacterium]
MRRNIILGVLLMAMGTGLILAARALAQPQDRLAEFNLTRGYRHWYHVRSMVVYDKSSPMFSDFPGLHDVYVNELGYKPLRTGGKYPDGTVFVFDLFALDAQPGSYAPGNRMALAVMAKDSKNDADTGGWAFYLFDQGNPSKQMVTDAKTQCYSCHQQQRGTDGVFSNWIP